MSQSTHKKSSLESSGLSYVDNANGCYSVYVIGDVWIDWWESTKVWQVRGCHITRQGIINLKSHCARLRGVEG